MPRTLTDVEQVMEDTLGHLNRRLIVIVGPSGVGKHTIIKRLLANHPDVMDRVVTYTTRERREDEVEGEQYHFVTPEQFMALARAGKLMEVDARLMGHDVYGLGKQYSMPADLFEKIPVEKHMVLAEVDVVGAQRLRGQYPDCVTIFVTAPPKELIRRVLKRRDETMDHESLVQRMNTAREQFRAARQFDYVVFNHDGQIDATVERVDAIIRAERMRVLPGFDLETALPEDVFDSALSDRS